MNTTRNLKSKFAIRLRSLMFLIMIFTIGLYSCKTTDQERQAAKIAKVEETKKKEAQKEYENARKRHMDIQDKKTRKRMQGNRSKMMEQTNVKKKSWWAQIFKRKPKSCRPKK